MRAVGEIGEGLLSAHAKSSMVSAAREGARGRGGGVKMESHQRYCGSCAGCDNHDRDNR